MLVVRSCFAKQKVIIVTNNYLDNLCIQALQYIYAHMGSLASFVCDNPCTYSSPHTNCVALINTFIHMAL